MWLLAEDLQWFGDDRFLHHWIQGTIVLVIVHHCSFNKARTGEAVAAVCVGVIHFCRSVIFLWEFEQEFWNQVELGVPYHDQSCGQWPFLYGTCKSSPVWCFIALLLWKLGSYLLLSDLETASCLIIGAKKDTLSRTKGSRWPHFQIWSLVLPLVFLPVINLE